MAKSDVIGNVELVTLHFGLDRSRMQARANRKMAHLGQWHRMLDGCVSHVEALEFAAETLRLVQKVHGPSRIVEMTQDRIAAALALADPPKPDLSAEREIVVNVMIPPAPDARLDRANSAGPLTDVQRGRQGR